MNRAAQKEVFAAPGTDIAGYRVLKELGTGAASFLYLVQDPRSKHIWTLKQVRRETEKDQRFLDQTENEYDVGSQLNHPHIRHIIRLIKTRRVIRVTEIILILEFVDGISLDRHPPTTFLAAADVFQHVSDGLLFMHGQGFVHADMKPNNVIVTDAGDAKIIDLGQSCRIGTTKERIQGTIDYIAPEQVHRRAITPATDAYNLGATMYWCITGRHIPTAMTDRTGLGIAKEDHQLERPVPPHEIDDRIPAIFSDLIMECVEPDPLRRPSMEVVRNRLQVLHVKLESLDRQALAIHQAAEPDVAPPPTSAESPMDGQPTK